MRTFERYLIHFSIIGIAIFVIAIVLIFIDDKKLLIPGFILTLIIMDISFVSLMSMIFSRLASSVQMEVSVVENSEFEKNIINISESKWNRKEIAEDGNKIIYRFGNKYKDWLTNPIILERKESNYIIQLPSAYLEDVKKIIK